MSKSVKSRSGAPSGAERPQWSTVCSDGVLACLTFYACSQLMDSAALSAKHGARGAAIANWQLLAAAALALTGAAASAGTLRFAGVGLVRPLHDFLTQLSMFGTMPVLGLVSIVAFTSYTLSSVQAILPLVLLCCGFLAFQLFPRRLSSVREDYVIATSLFGVMCVFFRAVFVLTGQHGEASLNAQGAAKYGLVGAVLVLVAGGVGAKGTLVFGPMRFLKVDIFHYVMAAANTCLVHLFQALWA